MNGTSMRTMRYLFFGVGLVGGVILLAAGQTLIGGLLVAMAAVRIVLLVSMHRRMRSSSSQAPGADGRRRGGRQMLQRLASMELDVAATAIGVAPDVLRHAVADGRIAPDRASMLRSRLPNWAAQLVVQTPTMLAGPALPPA